MTDAAVTGLTGCGAGTDPGWRRTLGTAVGAALALVLAAGPAQAADPLPEPARLLGWVGDLAGPVMDGRAAGTEGADRAARYLADHFRRIGLLPLGDGGGYLQHFAVSTRVLLGFDNRLDAVLPTGPPLAFTPPRDFLPLTFSSDGDVRGEVVFAGFGITAPPVGYDDYAGLDARGKVVLVMTGEPREGNPQGPFRPPEHFHYTELRHKVLNAREHGALAVLVVETSASPSQGPRPLQGTTPAWGLVAVSVTTGLAEALLTPSGSGLAAVRGEIDRTLAPRSRVLPGVTVGLRVALVRERGDTANVIGLLPGTDPRLRDEAIVVGGHYDHLGHGNPFSLDPAHGDEIHPGADDNASGTAAVIGLAEAFARAGGARRSLVFVGFSGEELGLLGSSHYVQHPPWPLERTVAMVNLDMVGRMEGGKLYALGVDSAQGLRALVGEAGRGLDVQLVLRGDGIGPSDHTAFYNRDRPVVFFFTGTHGDYHRPSDTVDKINAVGMANVVAVAYRTVRALGDRDDRPLFARVSVPAPAPRGARGGYGPYFGSVPDFGENATPGVKLGGVRPGSPAERVGLRNGDVIVRFAGVAVRTLDDLVFALRGRRPGDTVEVTYVRDGTEQTVHATLEQRR